MKLNKLGPQKATAQRFSTIISNELGVLWMEYFEISDFDAYYGSTEVLPYI